MAEAVEAVALGCDGGVFYAVEMAANLFSAVDAVVKIGDERGDGSFKVNIVFPERVICIYE